MKFISFLLALAVAVAANRSPVILSVPQVFQQASLWCWSATSQAVLHHYGINASQQEIAGWAAGGANTTSFFYGASDDRPSVEMILNHYQLATNRLNRVLSLAELQTTFDQGGVAVIRWTLGENDGHFLLLHGYIPGTDSIFIMDPQVHHQTAVPYNWILAGDGHLWVNSLVANRDSSARSFELEKSLSPHRDEG